MRLAPDRLAGLGRRGVRCELDGKHRRAGSLSLPTALSASLLPMLRSGGETGCPSAPATLVRRCRVERMRGVLCCADTPRFFVCFGVCRRFRRAAASWCTASNQNSVSRPAGQPVASQISRARSARIMGGRFMG